MSIAFIDLQAQRLRLNGKIEAVVIYDGIPVPSQHDVPLLRDFLSSHMQLDASSLAPREVGVTLARLIKRIRPELDIYLLTDRAVEKLAGDPAASMIRRVFYEVEELMEVHLNILEGVGERFSTPFFDIRWRSYTPICRVTRYVDVGSACS